jgi:hypothetical protein
MSDAFVGLLLIIDVFLQETTKSLLQPPSTRVFLAPQKVARLPRTEHALVNGITSDKGVLSRGASGVWCCC